MTTNAMPLSAGIAVKNRCNAGMVPADPPSATIGSIW